MNIPEWVKPAASGAVAGGIAVAIVGFAWGGWVTGGSAQASALSAANTSRTDLAAAICVQNFMAQDDARERLADLKAERSAFRQRDMINAGGYATMPDQEEAATATATLCARMLSALEPIELPVVDDGEVIEEGEVIEGDQMAPAVEPVASEAEPVSAGADAPDDDAPDDEGPENGA